MNKIIKCLKKIINFLKLILIIIAIVFSSIVLIASIVYLCFAIIYLLPIGIEFINGNYVGTSTMMPNYSTVFQSIFTLVSIFTSLSVSLLLYKLNKQQNAVKYNKELVAPANLVYFKIKYYLIHHLIEELRRNRNRISNDQYRTQNGLEESDSIIYENIAQVNVDTLENNIYKILCELNDDRSINKLLGLYEDMRRSNSIIYILKDELTNSCNLVETRGYEWVKVLVGLHNNNFECLNEDYKKIMYRLLELSKRKK